jgi:UDP-N-acetylglucosamine-lysosomal-enzyme
LYFNDDFFLGAPVALHDFVGADGAPLVYLSHQLPACAEGCKDAMLADLYCDLACNVSACAFDGGDCAAGGADGVLFRPLGGGEEEDALDALFASSAYEGAVPSDMTCAPGCSLAWVADGMCDEACKGAGQCGFDGGDCASSPLPFVLRVQGARTVLPRPRGASTLPVKAHACALPPPQATPRTGRRH